MKVDLTKDQIIHMVMGVTPNYSLFEDELIKRCGEYNGSYGTWSWKGSELSKLSELQLLNMYEQCVDSFK